MQHLHLKLQKSQNGDYPPLQHIAYVTFLWFLQF